MAKGLNQVTAKFRDVAFPKNSTPVVMPLRKLNLAHSLIKKVVFLLQQELVQFTIWTKEIYLEPQLEMYFHFLNYIRVEKRVRFPQLVFQVFSEDPKSCFLKAIDDHLIRSKS